MQLCDVYHFDDPVWHLYNIKILVWGERLVNSVLKIQLKSDLYFPNVTD